MFPLKKNVYGLSFKVQQHVCLYYTIALKHITNLLSLKELQYIVLNNAEVSNNIGRCGLFVKSYENNLRLTVIFSFFLTKRPQQPTLLHTFLHYSKHYVVVISNFVSG